MKFRANGKINLSSSELSKIAETTDLADAKYRVQVRDSSYNTIWRKENISVTSVLYDGPALASGTTYYFDLGTRSISTCPDGSSWVGTNFTTP